MSKKTVIILSVVLIISLTLGLVVVFYKNPAVPLRYESITVGYNGAQKTFHQGDEGYQEARKMILKTMRSSHFSIFSQGKLRTPCDDFVVDNFKYSSGMWVELDVIGRKTEKIAFPIDPNLEEESLLIYPALSDDTYNGGSVKVYHGAHTKELITYIKNAVSITVIVIPN